MPDVIERNVVNSYLTYRGFLDYYLKNLGFSLGDFLYSKSVNGIVKLDIFYLDEHMDSMWIEACGQSIRVTELVPLTLSNILATLTTGYEGKKNLSPEQRKEKVEVEKENLSIREILMQDTALLKNINKNIAKYLESLEYAECCLGSLRHVKRIFNRISKEYSA